MKQKIIFVKLGGSLITDKKIEKSLRVKTIKRLCQEVKRAVENSNISVILGNGGGSFSHPPSTKYKIANGYKNKDTLNGISEVQNSGSQLNRIIVNELIKLGLPAVSINPSSCAITKGGEVVSFYTEPLISSVKLGMIPVLYGDVIFDRDQGCSDISTEKLFNYLANNTKEFKVQKIVYCGITDGIYDKNCKTITIVSNNNLKRYWRYIKSSDGIDVTGGMLHKVREAIMLAETGIESMIINGNRENCLFNVLMGKPVDKCTLITSSRHKNENKKAVYKKEFINSSKIFLQNEPRSTN